MVLRYTENHQIQMKHFILQLITALLFSSCSGEKPKHVERAFYYWKSNDWSLNSTEDSIIDKCKIRKLYIKFFEVEKNSVMGLVPVSKTELHLYNKDSLVIVPTVYLRNDVFKGADHATLDKLADNVNFLINKYKEDKFQQLKADEYQMDCDWTISTKDNYFYFLKKIKQLSGKTISCTLRLYPYKYPDKMGVPPVDKAMLMCYNLINPIENEGKNSILDIKELKSYFDTDKKYPLKLDIALPLYSWVMVYQNNHFNEVMYTDTKNLKKILRQQKPMWYEVTKDTLIDGFYLRAGDKVKVEETTPEQMPEAIAAIKDKIHLADTVTVSLFHLDEQQLSRFSNEELSGFYTDFTK